MVQSQRTNCDVFEAILDLAPVGNGSAELEKAYNTLSDLLDLVYDTHGEILSQLHGNTRVLLELECDQVENHLLKSQKLLNGLIEAKNAKITK